jgi:hypothetical protein
MANFPCRPVDATFFESAPERHVQSVELACTPARLFEIFEDEASWPRWVPGITKVVWQTPAPRGAGAKRTVSLVGGAEILEEFTTWQPGRALAFHLLGTNQPIWHAFAEKYALDELPGGRTKLTWTVAYEPRDGFAKAHPFVRLPMGLALKGFLLLLKRYVAKQAHAAPVAAAA